MLRKLKKSIRVSIRNGKDLISGDYFQFAKPVTEVFEFPFVIDVKQEIKQSNLLKNKLVNIGLAISKIESVVIFPNQVFSFWNIVGVPSIKSGFLEGRNIVGGVVSKSVGGGLCQVSGIMYHVSLMADLEIIERHNHSLDLYTDETRYTPLGADATVVYGYKDLRVRNNKSFPIKFSFQLESDKLIIGLNSMERIEQSDLCFDIEEKEKKKIVTTINNSTQKRLNTSVYLLP